jgi:hypothetical protein
MVEYHFENIFHKMVKISHQKNHFIEPLHPNQTSSTTNLLLANFGMV